MRRIRSAELSLHAHQCIRRVVGGDANNYRRRVSCCRIAQRIGRAGSAVQVNLTQGATGGPFTAATLISIPPSNEGSARIVAASAATRHHVAATLKSRQLRKKARDSNLYKSRQRRHTRRADSSHRGDGRINRCNPKRHARAGSRWHGLLYACTYSNRLACAQAVGIARAAYEATLQWVRERKAFGQAIGTFQMTHRKLQT